MAAHFYPLFSILHQSPKMKELSLKHNMVMFTPPRYVCLVAIDCYDNYILWYCLTLTHYETCKEAESVASCNM